MLEKNIFTEIKNAPPQKKKKKKKKRIKKN